MARLASRMGWLFLPSLFVLGCWTALLARDPFLRCLPCPKSAWLLGGPSVTNGTAEEGPGRSATTVLPKTRYDAWLLGSIAARLQVTDTFTSTDTSAPTDASTSTDPSASTHNHLTLLHQAASVLHVPPSSLTHQDVLAVGASLSAMAEKEASLKPARSSRILAFFSFVNVLWCLAILGVSVSILPAARQLLGPLAIWLVTNIFAPIAHLVVSILLKLQPLYEAFAYLTCLYIIGASLRYPTDSAPWIALSGSMFAIPVFYYSLSLHEPSRLPTSFLTTAFNSLIALVLIPVALMHGSSLAGFLATAGLFGVLGFQVVPLGLHWVVGYGSARTMESVAVASALILAAIVGIRAFQVDETLVAPFRLGLATFGAINLFLAGLIMSSVFYTSRYGQYNLGYLALLLVAVFLGAHFNIAPLFNTAVTFLVLWVGEKVAENAIVGSVWIIVFFGSIALWYVAFFLKTNPTWVSTMFDWSLTRTAVTDS